MAAEHITVIGAVEHDRVLGDSLILEGLQNTADFMIHGGGLRVIHLQFASQPGFVGKVFLLRRRKGETGGIVAIKPGLRALVGFVRWTEADVEAPGVGFLPVARHEVDGHIGVPGGFPIIAWHPHLFARGVEAEDLEVFVLPLEPPPLVPALASWSGGNMAVSILGWLAAIQVPLTDIAGMVALTLKDLGEAGKAGR